MKLFGGITLPGRPDLQNIRQLDTLPLPQIRRMMDVGVAIDREYLWNLSSRLEKRKTELSQEIASYVPLAKLEQFVGESDHLELALNVESAAQISTLLFETLQIGSSQILKRTKSGARISSGKKQLEALKRSHPVIPPILEYRECSKLGSMIVTIISTAVEEESGWAIHGDIVTTRTDTGRLAMRRPNLQNVPARSALGRELRAGFIARPGKILISCDYSQIELRLIADRSGDENMLRIFRQGGDIHLDTAMRAFEIDDPTKVDKLLHRAPAKNVNFAVGYSISAPGLYDLMALTFAVAGQPMPESMTIEWCEEFIKKWFTLYPQAEQYFELQRYRARHYGIVWSRMGRVRRVPEVYSTHHRVRQAGLRQAGNMPIQGYAADIFKLGMARVERRLRVWRDSGVYAEALLPVHDELLIEVDPHYAEEIKEMVIWEMEQALVDTDGVLHCQCPILAEGKTMPRWVK